MYTYSYILYDIHDKMIKLILNALVDLNLLNKSVFVIAVLLLDENNNTFSKFKYILLLCQQRPFE